MTNTEYFISWDYTESIYGGSPMTGGGTIYDAHRHFILPHCHWLNIVRKRLNNPDLFVYFHRETATFVLACWIFRPGTGKGPGLITELETLTGHPDREAGDLPCLEYLRLRCCPARDMRERVAKKVRRLMYERRKDMEDDAYARKEYATHLRHQFSDPAIARSVANGAPWVRPDKITDEDWQKYARLAEKL